MFQKFTRILRFTSNLTMNWLHRFAFLTITRARMTRFWNDQLPHNLEFILLLECHGFGPLWTHLDDQNPMWSQKGRELRQKAAVSHNKNCPGCHKTPSSVGPGYPELACQISGHSSCLEGKESCFHDFQPSGGWNRATIHRLPHTRFYPVTARDTRFWFRQFLVGADIPEQLLRPRLAT